LQTTRVRTIWQGWNSFRAEGRTPEIGRMISGTKLTDIPLKHAEQMLEANR